MLLSKSSFNLSNLDDLLSSSGSGISGVMDNPEKISDFDNSEDSEFENKKKMIIVAYQLPVIAYREENTKNWCFDWDKDALFLQLKDGCSPDMEVVYVGNLKVEIHPEDQEEVSKLLLDKFRCIPTFLPLDLIDDFFHAFCKHYLWHLFHYMLPVTSSHGVRFDKSMWRAYVHANQIYADKVREFINEDKDYVWIHDYHFMVLPTILRKKFHRIRLGFFLHSPFPTSEIYRTIPVREEILKGLLHCDLIGFHTFDYARHFLSCCGRMLGLDYKSKRGCIGLDYHGRTVNVKILPVGIHMSHLESVMSLPSTVNKVKELKDKYDGKIVLLGVDEMDMFKGINLKFLAMGEFLDQHPKKSGEVVLVQIMNPAQSRGNDVEDVQDEIFAVADEINQKHGNEGYKPIVCIKGPVSTYDKVAYYAISEGVVVTPVRDGMNLVPYKYTVARQGTPTMARSLELAGSSSLKKSVIVVSEFIGCSPSLSGAIRVNPWDINSVASAMNLVVNMSDKEKEMRHEKHYNYVASHDVTYWARSFCQDLVRACSEHYQKMYWEYGFGLSLGILALDPNFRRLNVEHVLSVYEKSLSRLILLDYDGTMMPVNMADKSPGNRTTSLLNGLCSDPKNVVFIVSGRGKDTLVKWFSRCDKLGLSAEHGCFTRWTKDSQWESCISVLDLDWKNVTLPVMEHYREATDGSYIEIKESALVWHHQEADPQFGSWQAKELFDHLESVLANEPVVVTRGHNIVEVKPQGVNKGVAAKNLIAAMTNTGKAPDFILCIGDDRSDEDMFESVANCAAEPDGAEVFACSVGLKPSKAKYYVLDTFEVMKALHILSASSAKLLLEPLQ